MWPDERPEASSVKSAKMFCRVVQRQVATLYTFNLSTMQMTLTPERVASYSFDRFLRFCIVSVKTYIEFSLCDEMTKNILNGCTGGPNKANSGVYYTPGEHKIIVWYFSLSPTSIFEALSEG